VNPISGGKSKSHVPDLIKKHLDHGKFTFDIYWWKVVEGLPNAIVDFAKKGGYAVVAVGGDGTINSVVASIYRTDLRLAIIPQGSGNGFARELKISRSIPTALQQLNQAAERKLDIGLMNDRVFINVAGWGFDAKVSHTFSTITKRGLRSYAKAIMSDYGGSTNLEYKMLSDGESTSHKAFMLSVANGRQWGNNFFMAPKASLSDGILDVVYLKKPRLHEIIWLVCCLYFRMPNRLITRVQTRKSTVTLTKPIYTHFDGEPADKVSEVRIEVVPGALNILV
jgi:diacylglycerol kinase (ATP)